MEQPDNEDAKGSKVADPPQKEPTVPGRGS